MNDPGGKDVFPLLRRIADALGKRGIPNRVDEWGGEWDHDWPTWRKMLPQYLDELL